MPSVQIIQCMHLSNYVFFFFFFLRSEKFLLKCRFSSVIVDSWKSNATSCKIMQVVFELIKRSFEVVEINPFVRSPDLTKRAWLNFFMPFHDKTNKFGEDFSLVFTEAVVQRCSVKKVFLKISQNSQGNTCARVSFLIKLQSSGWTPLVAASVFIRLSNFRLMLPVYIPYFPFQYCKKIRLRFFFVEIT